VLLNPDSDVFPVFAWFLVDFFIDMSLYRENFQSGYAGADTRDKKNQCGKRCEKPGQ
jgi:hypothetical protein